MIDALDLARLQTEVPELETLPRDARIGRISQLVKRVGFFQYYGKGDHVEGIRIELWGVAATGPNMDHASRHWMQNACTFLVAAELTRITNDTPSSDINSIPNTAVDLAGCVPPAATGPLSFPDISADVRGRARAKSRGAATSRGTERRAPTGSWIGPLTLIVVLAWAIFLGLML